jgi:hypothetical protein
MDSFVICFKFFFNLIYFDPHIILQNFYFTTKNALTRIRKCKFIARLDLTSQLHTLDVAGKHSHRVNI